MINYPLGFNDLGQSEKEINYKSRGMSFESRINKTNEFYAERKIAFISKRPTPIRVIDVDEGSKLITKAVFLEDSTTDYNGIYKGHYVDFEAKSTTNKTSFPLSNLEEHQFAHLEEIDRQKGIAFLLIEFSKLDEIYLLPFARLKEFVILNKRKSIPLEYLKSKGFYVRTTIKAYVDYLENIEIIFDI